MVIVGFEPGILGRETKTLHYCVLTHNCVLIPNKSFNTDILTLPPLCPHTMSLVVSPSQFTIQCDTSGPQYPPYQHGGIARQVKIHKTMNFVSLLMANSTSKTFKCVCNTLTYISNCMWTMKTIVVLYFWGAIDGITVLQMTEYSIYCIQNFSWNIMHFSSTKLPIILCWSGHTIVCVLQEPLERQLSSPNCLLVDFAKMEAPRQLHTAFLALHQFSLSHNGDLPRARYCL